MRRITRDAKPQVLRGLDPVCCWVRKRASRWGGPDNEEKERVRWQSCPPTPKRPSRRGASPLGSCLRGELAPFRQGEFRSLSLLCKGSLSFFIFYFNNNKSCTEQKSPLHGRFVDLVRREGLCSPSEWAKAWRGVAAPQTPGLPSMPSVSQRAGVSPDVGRAGAGFLCTARTMSVLESALWGRRRPVLTSRG